MSRYHEGRLSKPQIAIALTSRLSPAEERTASGPDSLGVSSSHCLWAAWASCLWWGRELQKCWPQVSNTYLGSGSQVVRFRLTPPVWRREAPGNKNAVRMMYLVYWLMILGGTVLWIVVGLTVE